MAYDSARDRMILYGGQGSFSDAWALRLGASPSWTNITPDAPRPDNVTFAGGIYDAARDRMLIAGGWSQAPDYNYNNDVYALTLGGGNWLTTLAVTDLRGTIARSPQADAFAPGSVVQLTAIPGSTFTFDHWEGDASGNTNPLSVTMTANKTIIAVFGLGATPAAIERFEAERAGDGVRIGWSFGAGFVARHVTLERAANEIGPWSDLSAELQAVDGGFLAVDPHASADRDWYYRLSATLANGTTLRSSVVRIAATAPVTRTELAAAFPNPGNTIRLDFALAREGPLRLSVIDVTGREVSVLADGVRPAGRYHAMFGRGAGTHGVAPGVYFVRFVSREVTQVRRIAIVP